jgi:hypothetical protein
MTRTKNEKPRRTRFEKMTDDNIKFDLKDVTDPKKLPENYLVIPENWPHLIDKWDTKLQAGGKLRIKRPLKVYRMTRVVKSVELCLELEPVEE